MDWWNNYSDIQKAGTIGGLTGMLGGMFGNSDQAYKDAMKQYEKYAQKGAEAQNPFYNAGTGAIPQYQDWLKQMQDPSKFINEQMGNYQASPYAQYQQQQQMNALNNMASASGLMGSTPAMQQAQQNAQNISSQDMQQYLNNVLGINTQYGQGVGNMMNMGQGAANQLTNLYGNMGQNMGQLAYNQRAAKNNDFWNMLSGAGSAAMWLL